MKNAAITLSAVLITAGLAPLADASITDNVSFTEIFPLVNPDFEDTPFDNGWANNPTGQLGQAVGGLNGTATAVFIRQDPGGTEFSDRPVAVIDGILRLELFFASAQPGSGNANGFDLNPRAGPSLGSANANILLRVNGDGDFQYNADGGTWTDIVTGFSYSTSDGSDLTTRNVYRLRVDMLLDGGNSVYDVYLSDPNSTTLPATPQLAGAAWKGAANLGAGDGFGELLLRPFNATVGGDYIADELRFFEGAEITNEITITEVTVDDVMGVEFTSTVNEVYRLQSTESPASGMWDNTPLMLEGTGGPITAFDPSGVSTQKTYRILEL